MVRAQKAAIGLEVGPEAVRAVALAGRARNRIVAFAERNLESPDEMVNAAAQVVTRLGVSGPVRAILLGAGTQHVRLRLPVMSRREFKEAVALRTAQELGESLEGYLFAEHVSPCGVDGQRDVAVLCMPCEPLDSLSSILASTGHLVVAATSPAALIQAEYEPGDDPSGLLWADVGGTRTVLTLLRGKEVVLSREIRPRDGFDWQDETARFDRQLTDFQEIERSILYYRQNLDEIGVKKLIFSGPREDIERFGQQFRGSLEERGIAVELRPSLEGIELATAATPKPEDTRRLGTAVRVAAPRGRLLAVRPHVALQARTAQRVRLYAGLGASALAVAALVHTASLRWDRDALLEEVALAERQLDLLAPIDVTARSTADSVARVKAKIVPDDVPDWSGLIEEVGLLAESGIDYEQLDFKFTENGPMLTVKGRVDSPDVRVAGDLLSGLIRGIEASPYVRSLPRVLATSQESERHPSTVAFSLEAPVFHGNGSAGKPPS